MFIRYYDKTAGELNKSNCAEKLSKHTKLFKEEDTVPGNFSPFYTIVYVRSTENDVVAFKEEELVTSDETFYKTIRYRFPSDAIPVFDEGIVASRHFLEQILEPSEMDNPQLPINSFPHEAGCKYIESIGACLIMDVIVNQEYFDKLQLKKGYMKVPFNAERFRSNDELTAEVIKTFVKVHRPM